MQFKSLIIGCLLEVLELITRIQAVPIEVVYTGDSCDCPKKLNYLVNMPLPPEPVDYQPNEYGYNVERPAIPKARVTYSFDFMVEEPKKPAPPPEIKWDLFAKIDRIAENKKDCYTAEKVDKPCGCNRYDFDTRYATPDGGAPRYTRNLKQSDSIDKMIQSPLQPAASSHIMAIFFKPLKQTNPSESSKSRNKRAIARIFMRPRTKTKRSDRLIKKYNKGLKDYHLGEKTFYDDNEKSIRSRGIVAAEPLQQLKRFLTLPHLRSKRDIKGEYDLIEKEREQMDLTLPEIIQYMPETLNPNFQRSQCSFGQGCQQPKQSGSTATASTTNTTTTSTNKTSETSTMSPTKDQDNEDSNQDPLSASKANSLHDNEQEKQIDNSISGTHMKRNAGHYTGGGCPTVTKADSPTPRPRFTYETIRGPIAAVAKDYGSDPVPQQYVGSSYNPYSSAIIDNNPLLRNANDKSAIQYISNDQLDRLIANIVSKHSDFVEASSHSGGALVDPPQVQREQAKYFIKNLLPWNDLRRVGGLHGQLRPYSAPAEAYVAKLPHYQ